MGCMGMAIISQEQARQVNERIKTKRVQIIFTKPTHLQRKRPTAIPIH